MKKVTPLTEKTLVIGNGPQARCIAEELLAKDADLIVASEENAFVLPFPEKTEILTGVKIRSCEGSVGNFNLTLDKDGEKVSRIVENVIIAEEAVRKPNFSLYGLTPCANVISLSQLKESLSDDSRPFFKNKKFVFLTGLAKESNAVILEEIMRASLKLQSEFHAKTYILTKNLKVAGHGLELLYRRTKEAGAVYIKFTESQPEIHQQEDDGPVILTFTDDITGEQFRLTPDITVADETISPPENTSDLAAIFGLDTDPHGFLQSDNVHRISVLTNRKGIMVAGPSRDIQSPGEEITDTGNLALSIFKPSDERETASAYKAQINPRLCSGCLTCYSVCPYNAILPDTTASVMPDACEQCGVCAAVCLSRAITIKGLTYIEISDHIEKNTPQKKETFTPFLLAFCCKRSAARAHELASCMGHKLPPGLKIIEVPCAGGVSHYHIFLALRNNADGVLVLTCHEGNCHSERGNLYAHEQLNMIGSFLEIAGFEKERLLIKPLASNMSKEFAEITNTFEKKILDLGPSRFKMKKQDFSFLT
ncbi:Methyl-viologen-reducing hydrogenase family protein [Desulfonema magnum]|uniref:Methyl-viologen-reducing hydrogenase family protein n=1 Tax=Desulfonema magnum TaxID=45655 RepID=A0A975BNU8_9BACT|nr:Methyl-viologen-reducing hydrogenase family protein [Desulfonema magnum]